MTVPAERPTATSAGQTGRRAIAGIAAAGVGMLLAVQARINGTLGDRLGDGVTAGVVSFGVGFVVLLLVAAATPAARRGARRVARSVRSAGGLRPWECLGGVCGGYLVFAQGTAAALIGVALFTIAVVAGQVLSGMVVDRLGLGPAGKQPVTPPRLVGAALAVVAVVIAMSTELGGSRGSWLVLLPALAGIGLGWQAAVNGLVKQTAESNVAATTLNFGVGTVALLAALAVTAAVRGLPGGFPPEPWLYTGGLLGIFVIGGSVALVRHTGVLLLSLGMISGQLIGALLLDLLVPAPGTHVGTSTVVGVLLTLVAVGVASLPTPRLPR